MKKKSKLTPAQEQIYESLTDRQKRGCLNLSKFIFIVAILLFILVGAVCAMIFVGVLRDSARNGYDIPTESIEIGVTAIFPIIFIILYLIEPKKLKIIHMYSTMKLVRSKKIYDKVIFLIVGLIATGTTIVWPTYFLLKNYYFDYILITAICLCSILVLTFWIVFLKKKEPFTSECEDLNQ